MSEVGNIVKSTVDILTPNEVGTERLIFRKFEGNELSKVAESGGVVNPGFVTTVMLKVHPEQANFNQPKITQKVQTNAPGRFVIFDWGTDLLVITISGNTGNMLPGIITSGFNPLAGMVTDVVAKINPSVAAGAKSPLSSEVTGLAQTIMMETLSYYEMLAMSPKYRTFNKLRDLYETFDADLDVLTLEMGESIYRGYFTTFSFTQTALSPWNWKYSIGLNMLNDLSKLVRRGDERFPDNDYIDLST